MPQGVRQPHIPSRQVFPLPQSVPLSLGAQAPLRHSSQVPPQAVPFGFGWHAPLTQLWQEPQAPHVLGLPFLPYLPLPFFLALA